MSLILVEWLLAGTGLGWLSLASASIISIFLFLACGTMTKEEGYEAVSTVLPRDSRDHLAAVLFYATPVQLT